MTPSRKETLMWMGGAFVIVVGVLGWLWFDQPPENLLPQQYRYGVM